MVETICILCGSAASEHVTTGTDFEYGTTTDTFNLVRCKDCGLTYMSPRPALTELPIIYPANYANYNVEGDYDETNRENLYYWMRYAGLRFMIERWLRKLFPNAEDLVILDVGCADGHALSCIKSARSHRIETHGVDISEDAVQKARTAGHTTMHGRFEESEFAAEHYDLVVASHVIEHVADPKEFVQKVAEILKPDGICILWTPNIGSIDAKWFRDKYWGPYCFPRHWFLFDRKSITTLAKQSGLEVATIKFNPTGSTWLYTFHSLAKGDPFWAKYADRLFPLEGSMKTNLPNFVRNIIFTAFDLLILLFTGETSNMGVVLQKPGRKKLEKLNKTSETPNKTFVQPSASKYGGAPQ